MKKVSLAFLALIAMALSAAPLVPKLTVSAPPATSSANQRAETSKTPEPSSNSAAADLSASTRQWYINLYPWLKGVVRKELNGVRVPVILRWLAFILFKSKNTYYLLSLKWVSTS